MSRYSEIDGFFGSVDDADDSLIMHIKDENKYCIMYSHQYYDNKTFYLLSCMIMKKLMILTLMIVCTAIMSGCWRSMSPEISHDTGAIETTIVEKKPIAIWPWQAIGTEPFRSLDYSGGTLAFTLADLGTPIVFTGIQTTLSGAQMIYTDMAMTITATTESGSCSDGMSDLTHPASITIVYSGETYQGCVKW